MKQLNAAFICLISALSSSAFAKIDIKNFREITDNVYRSGRPSLESLEVLKVQYNVRTIINIEDEPDRVAREERVAKQLGINFISSPMTTSVVPNDTEIDRLLSIMSDPSQQPVLLHCKHGEDRTGLVSALFRVLKQNWQPEKAYKEMMDLGFKFFYFKYKKYFRYRADWEDLEQEQQEISLFPVITN